MRAERAFDPPEQDSTSLESDALTLLAGKAASAPMTRPQM